MLNTLDKLLKKLDTLNNQVGKTIASEAMLKEEYENIDDAREYSKKLHTSITNINKENIDNYDTIESEFLNINSGISWMTGPIYTSKELLEIFIGNYRKQIEIGMIQHDE